MFTENSSAWHFLNLSSLKSSMLIIAGTDKTKKFHLIPLVGLNFSIRTIEIP